MSQRTRQDAWIATGVPVIANNLGLNWAGGYSSFGSYIDRVHFEIANKTEQLTKAQREADQWEYKTEES